MPNWPLEFLRYLHSLAGEAFVLAFAVLGFWRALKREASSPKPRRPKPRRHRHKLWTRAIMVFRPSRKGVRYRPWGS